MTERGRFNSSRTRVAPVFDAMSAHPGWIARLLTLCTNGAPGAPPIAGALDPVDGGSHWGDREKRLLPPVSLLSWLVRNFRGPVSGDSDTAMFRQKLADGDPATIELALLNLRTQMKDRGWWIFEGLSSPDAYVVTPDLLLVVEGKRTESRLTTQTEWMPQRHQIWRHLDAAWEIRGRRQVAGMLIVEAETGSAVPTKWLAAADELLDEVALAGSFPHRSRQETEAIAASFRGVTTWQAICDEFGLDASSVLVDTVHGEASPAGDP